MSVTKSTRIPTRLPSAEYLHTCFAYDLESGELIWRERPLDHFISTREWTIWNKRFAGTIAGCVVDTGYIKINIDGHPYLAHRLSWKLATGKEPPNQIDHKDGDRTNNAITNLREGTQHEHKYNKKFRPKNISGYRGVYITARIKMPDGVNRHLGNFATVEEASAAYEEAAKKLHGEFYQP